MICLYELVRIKISRRCNGYFLRWYYNGWHYWLFRTGSIAFVTEGEKYRTLGTQKMTIGTGQINESESNAIRTILNTREVSIYTSSGWGVVRVEPGSMIVYDHALHGYEAEITIIIGSKQVSKTGYSPAKVVPVVVPSVVYCEVVVGTQIWMCKNWDIYYPGSKVYGDDEDNRAIYGGLYTFDQVNTPGFVPDGWHVPTEAEWLTLIDFVGDATDAGGKLKEAGYDHWLLAAPPTPGTDDYGFAALGAGYGYPAGNFAAILQRAWFWTADAVYHPYGNYGKFLQLKNEGLDAASFESITGMYLSVRLIKDTAAPPLSFSGGFLPSRNELNEMFTELKAYGVGGFANDYYWSSSESTAFPSLLAWNQDFLTGAMGDGDSKGLSLRVRACRTFTALAGAYSLRDMGPSGGLIFYIEVGAPNSLYFEAAPVDCVNSVWSNIDNVLLGTTSIDIGEGQDNTNEIIGQAGHTTSAAKLCDDLVI